MTRSGIGVISLLVLTALGLSGCGVKGALQPPAGVENQSGPPDQSKPTPHKPFILDGLLQ